MKTHFLKISLLAISFMMFALSVQAQKEEKQAARFDQTIEKMTEMLGLTEAQIPKYIEIEKAYMTGKQALAAAYPKQKLTKEQKEVGERSTLTEEQKLAKKERTKKMKELNRVRKENLMALLTPEQVEILKSQKESKRAAKESKKKQKRQNQN